MGLGSHTKVLMPAEFFMWTLWRVPGGSVDPNLQRQWFQNHPLWALWATDQHRVTCRRHQKKLVQRCGFQAPSRQYKMFDLCRERPGWHRPGLMCPYCSAVPLFSSSIHLPCVFYHHFSFCLHHISLIPFQQYYHDYRLVVASPTGCKCFLELQFQSYPFQLFDPLQGFPGLDTDR